VYDYTIDLEDNTMKTFILTILAFITFQVYAGDLIILDRYYLEKSESGASNLGAEHEQEQERGKRVVRGEETDTQVESRDRNMDNYTIRRIKREIDDTNNDGSLFEYQF
jgi:hypothetical protein